MIGVLTGPSVINCFNSPDGMGVCLRGKMADAGLVPAPSAPSAPAQAIAETAPFEPTPAPEPAAEDAPETDMVAATFGLLRAEPDGSVVIAGSGEPGSEVEVYSNDELIGRATVEPSGDWVLVPEEPIPPGGTEITLAEAGKEGRAAQSFVVVIDPERDEQPLVVASEPGKASEVLQGLERPAASEPTIVASAPAEAVSAPAGEPTQASAAPEPVQPAPGQVADEAPAAPPADTQVADVPEPAESAPAQAEAATSDLPQTAAVAEPAEAASRPAASQPESTAAPPTVDAIEIDGDRTFFAGAGPDGATIRLYVDDAFVADAVVEGGRWLVEAGDILPGPDHVIRADLLAPGSADVISRAEVNFRVDVPEAPVAVAEAPKLESPATDAVAEESEPRSPPPVEEPASAAVSTEAPAAGASATPVTRSEEPVAVAETEMPTLVAAPVGDPELQRFASGRAIIRRGDNLWTIARRVYGEGIRYTTIYEANAGQIRDPDWIYPGQVFDLPQAD